MTAILNRVLLILFTLSLVMVSGAASQRLFAANPVCPTTIPFGTLFDCELTTVGEQDTFTFAGSANDKISFRVYRTSGEFSGRLTVRNTANVVVCQVDSFQANPLIQVSCSLTTSGNYTAVIDDEFGASVGTYQVYAQRLNNAGNALAITYGTITDGNLSSVIEGDTYSVEANQNDKLILRLYRTVGALSGRMRLFDRAGNIVCQEDAFQGGALVTIEPCIITQSGTFGLIIDDENGTALGDYQLHLQRYRNAGNVLATSYGNPITGTLSTPAEIDGYTYSADANDTLLIRIVRETGSYSPRIRMYDKDGDLVCQADAFQDDPVAQVVACEITDTGTHTLFVDDELLTQTGAYRLQVQRVNNPANATSLAFGQQISGQIEGVASFDTYFIAAESAQTFKLTMTRTVGSFSPRVQVYASSGDVICSADAFQGGATAEIASCAVTQTGQYTIIVDDENLNGVGDYTLQLSCVAGGCQQRVYIPLLVR